MSINLGEILALESSCKESATQESYAHLRILEYSWNSFEINIFNSLALI